MTYKKIIKATSIFASMTLVSRILGFARDTVVAQLFGASAAVDAFYIAFKIPSFLRGVAEGPFSQVFVPVLSEYRQTRSHEAVRSLISAVSGVMGSVLLIIMVLGIVGAEQWLKVVTPGLDPERLQLARDFLRITFPYLPLISLAALGVAVMNAYSLFWGAALVPIWLNISLIGTALGFSHYFSVAVTAQAWGVLLAGFAQLLFTLPFLKYAGLLTWPRLDWKDPGVRKILKLMGPAFLGASASQIGLLINTGLASFLPAGSITWLYYADRIVYFPLSVFGIALSTAMLPALSQQYASGDRQAFNSTLGWSLCSNLLIGLPAAITMGLLAGPLVVSLFAYGQFTSFDVLQTQQAVLGYALGVPAFMLSKALGAAFYAQQDIQTPVKVLFLVMIINIILGIVLVPGLKQGGITLASSLSTWVQVALLWYWLQRPAHTLMSLAGWKRWGLALFAANSILILFLYWATPILDYWLQWNWVARLSALSSLGLVAILLYSGMLRLNGLRPRDIVGN